MQQPTDNPPNLGKPTEILQSLFEVLQPYPEYAIPAESMAAALKGEAIDKDLLLRNLENAFIARKGNDTPYMNEMNNRNRAQIHESIRKDLFTGFGLDPTEYGAKDGKEPSHAEIIASVKEKQKRYIQEAEAKGMSKDQIALFNEKNLQLDAEQRKNAELLDSKTKMETDFKTRLSQQAINFEIEKTFSKMESAQKFKVPLDYLRPELIRQINSRWEITLNDNGGYKMIDRVMRSDRVKTIEEGVNILIAENPKSFENIVNVSNGNKDRLTNNPAPINPIPATVPTIPLNELAKSKRDARLRQS